MTTLPARPPLARSSDRVIAGVCSGLAVHLGWPVKNVRIGMALATLAGGAGLVFYAWLWIMVPTADEAARRNARRPASPIAPAVSQPPAAASTVPVQGVGTPRLPAQGAASSGFGATPGPLPAHGTIPFNAGASGRDASGAAQPAATPWFRVRSMKYGKEILLGCGLLLVAGIMIAQLLGVDVPLGTLIPAAAVLGGASIAWMQFDETRRAGLVDKTKADQAGGWARLAAGLALVADLLFGLLERKAATRYGS